MARLGGDRSTGVLFEFEGCLEAPGGVFFQQSVRDVPVQRVPGKSDGPVSPGRAEVVHTELGKVLAPTVASAIADALGKRLLPSIPILATEGAHSELAALTSNRPGDHPVRVDCQFPDPEGQLRGLLVLDPVRDLPGTRTSAVLPNGRPAEVAGLC